MHVEHVRGYAHWASYFVNADPSGLEDEDIVQADAWYAWATEYTGGYLTGVAEDEDTGESQTYFARPEGPHGLLHGDCVDYVFLVRKDGE